MDRALDTWTPLDSYFFPKFGTQKLARDVLKGAAMPSLKHDLMLHLVRADPDIVLDFCRARQIELLPDATVAVEDSNLTVLGGRELSVDLALMLTRALERQLLLVEAQLGRDPEKRASWPGYIFQALQLYGCRIELVVLTLTAAMKRWASRHVEIGSARLMLTPLVMGPDDVPAVTRAEDVRARPELAVLSYMMHHRSEQGPAIEAAVFQGLRALTRGRHPHAAMYLDFVTSLMDKSKRAMVEKMWSIDDYRPVGAGKKFYDQGLLKGEARGKAEEKPREKLRERWQGWLPARPVARPTRCCWFFRGVG